jgi:hypothetical protein
MLRMLSVKRIRSYFAELLRVYTTLGGVLHGKNLLRKKVWNVLHNILSCAKFLRAYTTYRAVSGVFRTIDPHPLSEDARHWIGLLQYNPSTVYTVQLITLAGIVLSINC